MQCLEREKMVLPGPAYFAVCKPFTINYTVHGKILNEKSGHTAVTHYGCSHRTTVRHMHIQYMHISCMNCIRLNL